MDATNTMVIYSKTGEGTSEFMYAMALNDAAQPAWPGTSTAMSLNPSGITHAGLSAFEEEQVVVAWEDGRDDGGIYAQNIRSDGSIGLNDTNIPDYLNDDIKIYPNPVSEVVTIKTELFKEIVISNSLGQIISRRTINNNGVLTFRPSASGVYFITFTDGNRDIITKKVFVRRSKR